MTDPVPSIDTPWPDLAHEALRRTAVDAISRVTADIDTLRADLTTAQTQFTAAQGQIADLQAQVLTAQGQIADLQAQVAALTPVPPPVP